MLLSESVYVCLFARTGHWRTQQLPRDVVAEGWKQREIHKKGLDPCPCVGCEHVRKGFELVIDFRANDLSVHAATPTQADDPKLERLRAEKEALRRAPKITKKRS
jgi:hypothetical protein